MSVEFEDAILSLIDRLAGHSSGPLVSRDLRKLAKLSEFPAIFVAQRQDDAYKLKGPDTDPSYLQTGYLSTVSLVKGTTQEEAPAELATFQAELRKMVYGDDDGPTRKIGQYGAGIREIQALPIIFPPLGNGVVAQEIVWKIDYQQVVSRLFE